MKPMVEVENLKKRFRLPKTRPRTLRESAGALLARRSAHETIDALTDVTLAVQRGEFLGIIGANGSGKSTLLKILAGVLHPTSGSVAVRGRLSAFLELGVGHDPELSARENVFLNGIVLGLSRARVAETYRDIVAFADVARFMEAPLKTFSSGMRVRLAFASAISVPADILLLDEVLAVGDADFQERCFRVFREFKRMGKTIIFVSHDLGSIEEFCDRVAILDYGSLAFTGSPSAAIERYHRLHTRTERPTAERLKAPRPTPPRLIRSVSFAGSDGRPRDTFETGERLDIVLTYDSDAPIEDPVVGLALYTADGIHLTGPNTKTSGVRLPRLLGRGSVVYRVSRLPFLAGDYLVTVGIFDRSGAHAYDFVEKGFSFRVLPTARNQYGLVNLEESWHLP